MRKRLWLALLLFIFLLAPLSPIYVHALSSVGTSSDDDATASSPQRKVFYANGLWWVFWVDGTDDTAYYSTSSDGSTWSTKTALCSVYVGRGYRFAVSYNPISNKTAYVRYAGNGILYMRKGTPLSTGTISWDLSEVSLNTGSIVTVPTIFVDDEGDVWVTHYDASNDVLKVYRYDSSWNLEVSYSSSTPITGTVVQLGSDIYALVVFSDSAIGVKFKESGSWSSWYWTYSPDPSSYVYRVWSATTVGNTVYVAYFNSNGYYTLKWISSSGKSWSSGLQIAQAASTTYGNPGITLSATDNEVYVFYASTLRDKVLYKIYNGTLSSENVLISLSDKISIDRYCVLTSSFDSNGGRIGILWTGSISPYTVYFESLTIQQTYEYTLQDQFTITSDVSRTYTAVRDKDETLVFNLNPERVYTAIRKHASHFSIGTTIIRNAQFNRIPIEHFVITPEIGRTYKAVRGHSEVIQITDKLSRVGQFTRSPSETSLVSASVRRTYTAIRRLFSYIGLSDAHLRSAQYQRISFELIPLSSSIKRIHTATRGLSSSISLVSLPLRWSNVNRIAGDQILLYISATRECSLTRMKVVGFDVFAQPARQVQLKRTAVAQTLLSSVPQRQLQAIRSVPLNIIFTEDVLRRITRVYGIPESLTMTDQLSRIYTAVRAPTDAFGLQVEANRQGSYGRVLNIIALWQAESLRSAELGRLLSEPLAITAGAKRHTELVRYEAQPVSMGTAVISAKGFVRGVYAEAAVMVSPTRTYTAVRSGMGALSFMSSLLSQKGCQRVVAVSYEVNAQASREGQFSRTVYGAVQIAPVVSRNVNYTRVLVSAFDWIGSLSGQRFSQSDVVYPVQQTFYEDATAIFTFVLMIFLSLIVIALSRR